ncbi:MAG TPA: cation:dicarboxylase symporter family transporter, partial [Thermoanaerobaculia bacterium]|nr:cation:dicarboxylase symporter family transporter [Thermoanaerobaculia bacterium]
MKDSARVLVALVAALGIGVAIAAWGGPGAVAAADFVAPLGALWITAIRMTVIPLVVSLLVTGVASASDVKAIGRLGGRALLVFVLLLVVMCAVFIPLAPVIFGLLPQGAARPPLPAGAAEAAGQIAGGEGQTLAAWIGSLLPPNPIAAAAAGQMVPLILFTLLLALAIAKSAPASRATLVGFFTALGEAMMRLVTWVIAAAPVGVFALVLPLAAHAGAAVAGAMGFYVAAYSLGCIAGILLLYPLVRLLGGVPMGKFARAALPPQLIAFSSSSSIATLPALVDASERLGLGKRIGGFVLPLAVSIFHVSGPVTWSFGALFVSW